jgi:acetyltransferase-like isoleucine patch superfamily enzyme
MYKLLQEIIRIIAFKTGRLGKLYKKICRPSSFEYANFLRIHGKLHYIGSNSRINIAANITDPAYVSIGSNVTIANCNLIGHDGVIAMLNEAYQIRVDSVGKIDIKDNVFVGHGSIVLPNVTIGPNAIVAAGSVVNKDVAPGDIVGGVPAKVIGRVDDLAKRLKERTESLPWGHIIAKREGYFDPLVEDELVALRVNYFYPEDKS